MTVVMKIKQNWSADIQGGMDGGLAEMTIDIESKAKILAPVETGALANSGSTKKTGKSEYTVSFGSGRVPYARRRHFENKKTPSSREYLKKAGESVDRSDKSKYFRGKVS